VSFNSRGFLNSFLCFYETHHCLIQSRLYEFSLNPEERLLRELVFCICAAQTSPFKADNASQTIENIWKKKGSVEVSEVCRILKDFGVRFHNHKALYIVEALKCVGAIQNILSKGMNPLEEREIIARKVKGLGMKGSSHFLRNLGRTGLAIIDRHVLRFCRIIKLIPREMSLARRTYLWIEERLKNFCARNGLNIDVLDGVIFLYSAGYFLK